MEDTRYFDFVAFFLNSEVGLDKDTVEKTPLSHKKHPCWKVFYEEITSGKPNINSISTAMKQYAEDVKEVRC